MWHKVAKVSDIAAGCAQTLEISGKMIALFNLDGKFYAVDNRCLHRGGPLAQGHLEGNVVTCPWHAWQFDIPSGKCHTMPDTKQNVYPVKIEKDEVYVEVL